MESFLRQMMGADSLTKAVVLAKFDADKRRDDQADTNIKELKDLQSQLRARSAQSVTHGLAPFVVFVVSIIVGYILYRCYSEFFDLKK